MAAFKFDNDAEHVGSRGTYDWFKWRLFMDEPQARLDQVESVEYQLHETFPNPIRVVRDQDSGFALQSAGWGEFPIYITVHLKDGAEVHEEYDLDLAQALDDQGDSG